eukprot:GHVU01110097.1.p4 GENE.GHVU01110097.1~~GHVU01110097.1.p4  ORF type:complete len:135 (+),score=27.05 GHVU01110097.1:1500-1904(+)
MARWAGAVGWRLWLDPGVGFGKDARESTRLLSSVAKLRARSPGLAGLPWVVGFSRKRFVAELIGEASAAPLRCPDGTPTPHLQRRVTAGAIMTAWCVSRGVNMIRTHDVREAAMARQVQTRLEAEEAEEEGAPQ